jgi:hypothetical protein
MGTTMEHVSQRYTRRAIARGAVAISLTGLVVLATPGPSLGRDRDCSDFKTQKQAQRFFKKHGGPRKDPDGLDGDHDGKACEDLP